MGKRELVALLRSSSWCLVMVVWLLLAVPWVCLRFVIVVFPDHTHLIFLWGCSYFIEPAYVSFQFMRRREHHNIIFNLGTCKQVLTNSENPGNMPDTLPTEIFYSSTPDKDN